ncbi:hypothetical protein JTB14_027732 [Gonioctena quinquepunctata]|nr:hypothetical protein JTB14_027732 [Gonioctena quinquepunctata]
MLRSREIEESSLISVIRALRSGRKIIVLGGRKHHWRKKNTRDSPETYAVEPSLRQTMEQSAGITVIAFANDIAI